MNKETTFVYDNHPLFDMLVNSCSNYTDDIDVAEFNFELCCGGYSITARRIYSDAEKTSLAGYEILDYAVRPL